MTIEEASKILAQMVNTAQKGETALSYHMFGIQYAEQIKNMSTKDIVVGADLPVSYQVEVNKGINLARYVELKK